MSEVTQLGPGRVGSHTQAMLLLVQEISKCVRRCQCVLSEKAFPIVSAAQEVTVFNGSKPMASLALPAIAWWPSLLQLLMAFLLSEESIRKMLLACIFSRWRWDDKDSSMLGPAGGFWLLAFSQLCLHALGSLCLTTHGLIVQVRRQFEKTILSFIMWVLGKLRSIRHAPLYSETQS